MALGWNVSAPYESGITAGTGPEGMFEVGWPVSMGKVVWGAGVLVPRMLLTMLMENLRERTGLLPVLSGVRRRNR
ncbi:hypothetical protein D3C72_1481630 [compost metagenome]